MAGPFFRKQDVGGAGDEENMDWLRQRMTERYAKRLDPSPQCVHAPGFGGPPRQRRDGFQLF